MELSKIDLKPIEVELKDMDVTLEPIELSEQEFKLDVTLELIEVEMMPIVIDGITGDNRN